MKKFALAVGGLVAANIAANLVIDATKHAGSIRGAAFVAAPLLIPAPLRLALRS